MDDLRARLEHADDAELLRRFVGEAKTEGRRAGAIAFLRDLYSRRGSPALYGALRELCTLPELESIAVPAEGRTGRYGEEILARGSYSRLLAGIFPYPFSSHTARWIIVLGGPVFSGALTLLHVRNGLFLFLPALVFGYFLAYGFTVVQESIEGGMRAPGWPDAGEFGEYFACFFRWWMAATVSFLPALVALSFWTSSIEFAESASALAHPAVFIAAALGVLGMIYYPMGLLMAAAMESGLAPINVVRGFRAMGRLGLDYGIAWLGFALLSVAGTAIQWACGAATEGASWIVRVGLQVPVSWLLLYLLVLQMRALGLLYYARRDDIGWFR